MQDDHFEWDDQKAERNWLAHKISFEMAREIFKDVFAIEWPDNIQDAAEQRFATIGMVETASCLSPTQ